MTQETADLLRPDGCRALELGPIVVRWNDELLPHLVTSRGRQEEVVLERLEQLLLGLPRHGIHCFRFKDLVDPLKIDARQRWAVFLAREDSAGTVESAPDLIQVVRHAFPESTVESRQSFEHLTRCVSASIDRLDVDTRTRCYLAALWDHLLRRNGDGDPTKAGGSRPARDETDDGPLSHRQLSQRLQIPRERIPLLFSTLQQLVACCRMAGTRRRGGSGRPRVASPAAAGSSARV